MYVCICNAVTDHEIEAALDSGANCVATVGSSTRAGTTCGTCHDVIEDLIEARCAPCPLTAMRVA